MGKRTTLFAQLDVVPFESVDDKGEKEEGKQLIFTDHEGGEIILYPMGRALTKETTRLLGMSNKSLAAHHEEKARRAQAQAMLAGGNGTMPSPEEQKKIEEALKDLHRRGEGG